MPTGSWKMICIRRRIFLRSSALELEDVLAVEPRRARRSGARGGGASGRGSSCRSRTRRRARGSRRGGSSKLTSSTALTCADRRGGGARPDREVLLEVAGPRRAAAPSTARGERRRHGSSPARRRRPVSRSRRLGLAPARRRAATVDASVTVASAACQRRRLGPAGRLQPAPGAATRADPSLDQRRLGLRRTVPGIRAARLELAAGRHVERVRDRALDGREPLAALASRRDRVEQAPRVGVPRRQQDLLDGARARRPGRRT